MATPDLTQEIVRTVEQHADYDIPDGGFSEEDFVEWIMDGIGGDMKREGHSTDEVRAAAREAYALVTPRFRGE